MIVALLFTNCTKDDDYYYSGNVGLDKDDPVETVIINIMNTGTEYPIGADVTLSMKDNNFYGKSTSYGYYGYANVTLNTIGAVKGLGDITSVPTGMEWAEEVAAIPGYGYALKVTENSYGGAATNKYIRFYVVDWITSSASTSVDPTSTTGQNATQTSSGGIIGVVIKYQLNWTPQQ